MPLYFAYGSNMDRAAMASRCPASTPLGAARLMRHRFIITADGYASVLRDPGRTVWGVLWELALADVPALDRYEDVRTGLYRKAMQPVLTERGPRRALIYLGRNAEPGLPAPDYLGGIVAAAREAALPGDYVRELEAWTPGAPRAAPIAAGKPAVRPLWASPVAHRRTEAKR
jgi:gamma-glutamylcyclotransferase (GGCT)/AIG2-like uncharacterized protein YtfP